MSQHRSGNLVFPFPATAKPVLSKAPPVAAGRWVDLSGLRHPHASYLIRAPLDMPDLGIGAGDLLIVEYREPHPGSGSSTSSRETSLRGHPLVSDPGGNLHQGLREGTASVVQIFPGAKGLGYVRNLRPLRRSQAPSCAQG